jgi:ATPase subunit of ABC transporter with duplicated ATPase domains
MIRLDNISKQNGHHLLFIEASAALQRGEKVGLVGPNGSGKTALFRMITGEEQPNRRGPLAGDRGSLRHPGQGAVRLRQRNGPKASRWLAPCACCAPTPRSASRRMKRALVELAEQIAGSVP